MTDSEGGNAMTEVALALAMAFFSISILALVSMGAGGATPQNILEAVISADTENNDKKAQDTTAQTDEPPQYGFWWQGQWHDDKMQIIDVSTLHKAGNAILVFAPDMPLQDAMNARRAIEQGRSQADGLAIAEMTPEWQQAFQQLP